MPTHSPRIISSSFFAAFHGREPELAALFERFGIVGPDPIAAGSSLRLEPENPNTEHGLARGRLRVVLEEITKLASPPGREVIEQVCSAHGLKGPGFEFSGPRVALWFWLNHARLFEGAVDLLEARRQGPCHRGGCWLPVEGTATIDPEKLAASARAQFKREGWAGRLVVEENSRGSLLEFAVFWEGPAQVSREFGPGGLAARESRPVREAWLRYDCDRGELEIEGGTARERAALWRAFMGAAYAKSQSVPLPPPRLCLDHLLAKNFRFQTRPGHSARLDGVRIAGQRNRRRFSLELQADGTGANVREMILAEPGLREWSGEPGERGSGFKVEKARIALVLGPTRAGKKVIELSGPDEIGFDRATHAKEVYGYLREWRVLRDGLASKRVG